MMLASLRKPRKLAASLS